MRKISWMPNSSIEMSLALPNCIRRSRLSWSLSAWVQKKPSLYLLAHYSCSAKHKVKNVMARRRVFSSALACQWGGHHCHHQYNINISISIIGVIVDFFFACMSTGYVYMVIFTITAS
jgi:hypothetical protein